MRTLNYLNRERRPDTPVVRDPHGKLPVIDGPWLGEECAYLDDTFEVVGHEFASPDDPTQYGLPTVRYYRHRKGMGYVWSTAQTVQIGLVG